MNLFLSPLSERREMRVSENAIWVWVWVEPRSSCFWKTWQSLHIHIEPRSQDVSRTQVPGCESNPGPRVWVEPRSQDVSRTQVPGCESNTGPLAPESCVLPMRHSTSTLVNILLYLVCVWSSFGNCHDLQIVISYELSKSDYVKGCLLYCIVYYSDKNLKSDIFISSMFIFYSYSSLSIFLSTWKVVLIFF